MGQKANRTARDEAETELHLSTGYECVKHQPHLHTHRGRSLAQVQPGLPPHSPQTPAHSQRPGSVWWLSFLVTRSTCTVSRGLCSPASVGILQAETLTPVFWMDCLHKGASQWTAWKYRDGFLCRRPAAASLPPDSPFP